MVAEAGVHEGFANELYQSIYVIGHAVACGAERSASPSRTVIGPVRHASAASVGNVVPPS
jgi:hypothetical protein